MWSKLSLGDRVQIAAALMLTGIPLAFPSMQVLVGKLMMLGGLVLFIHVLWPHVSAVSRLYAFAGMSVLGSAWLAVYVTQRYGANIATPTNTTKHDTLGKESAIPASGKKGDAPSVKTGIQETTEEDFRRRFNERLRENAAAMAQSSNYRDLVVAINELRKSADENDQKNGCLFDPMKWRCLPKPPNDIDQSGFETAVVASLVAKNLDSSHIWLVEAGLKRMSIPLAIFVRLANHDTVPHRITYLSLESRTTTGWQEVRMAGTIEGASGNELSFITVASSDPSNSPVVGRYTFLKLLYERTISPSDYIDGWVLGEYPPMVTDGESVGDLRIALLENDRWISTATFRPRIADNAMDALVKKMEVGTLDFKKTVVVP